MAKRKRIGSVKKAAKRKTCRPATRTVGGVRGGISTHPKSPLDEGRPLDLIVQDREPLPLIKTVGAVKASSLRRLPERYPCDEWVSRYVQCGDTAMAIKERRHHWNCPQGTPIRKGYTQ